MIQIKGQVVPIKTVHGDIKYYVKVPGSLPIPSKANAGQYIRITSVDEKGKVTAVEAVDDSIFGTFTTETEVLPLQKISGFTLGGDFPSNNDGTAYTVANLELGFTLKERETYRILWDGKEYLCVSVGNAIGVGYVGNASINGTGGDDTDEPFIIVYTSANFTETIDQIAIATKDKGESHTVAIYHVERKSFLPVNAEDVMMPDGKRLSEAEFESDWATMKNKPFYEEKHNSNGTFTDAPDVFFDAMAGTFYTAYKVSDIVLTTEELLKMSIGIQSDAVIASWIPAEADILVDTDDITIFRATDTTAFAVARTAGEINYEHGGVSYTVPVPETGIYYLIEYGSEWSEISISFSYTELKKLDAVYLPEGIATQEYVDEKLAGLSDGPSETVILEEQVFTGFAYAEMFGYILNADALFTVEVGGTYRVLWDGVSYEVTAVDASTFAEGSILLGNGVPVGLSGNNEPFAIGWSSAGVTFFAFEDSAQAHTVAIYQIGSNDNTLPEVTVDDNGKVLQVVDGEWKTVAIADSAVKTYIDDYINEALGGDY